MRQNLGVLLEDLRALPRAAWYLFFGVFVNRFGTFVMPFLTLYLTRQGYNARQAGLAVAAYGLGTLTASLVGGWLADATGRRKTIIASMLLGAGAMLALSRAEGLSAILSCSALVGLTAELYRPAASALITDLVPAGRRLTAFAAVRLAHNAGFAIGLATAGLLASVSFTWLFLGDAATSLLFCAVAWLLLPADASRPASGRPWGEVFHWVRRDYRFLQLMAAVLCVGSVFMQIISTFGLELAARGYSPVTYGLLISMNGGLVVLAEIPLTLVTRRFAPRAMMALGFALIGFGFGLLGWVASLGGLVAAMALLTLGEMISLPVAAAYVSDLAPEHLRGTYMGLFGLSWAATWVAAPYLGTALFAYNRGWLWAGCALLGSLGAAIVLAEPGWARRCLRRSRELEARADS